MRTQADIQARTREAVKRDPFAFEWGEYIAFLDFEHAREFLKPEACTPEKAAEWDKEFAADTQLGALHKLNDQAKDYMAFWLEKIENERGLSVSRATMHFTAWKWLLRHGDADIFPGSFASDSDGGWYQRDAYEYVKRQVDSGEWDRLSSEALGSSQS